MIKRVIEYSAGAGGYSATGDIGPDIVAQNEAQSAFRNDPSVRAQTDVWNRAQSGSLGANSWNSQPFGWSSADPLWNVAALPKSPTFQPAQPTAPLLQPQRPTVSEDNYRKRDEKIQKSWDNSNENNWQKGERRSSGSIDWNTWNANQQTWTKQNRGPQQWTSNVNHQWPQTSGHFH